MWCFYCFIAHRTPFHKQVSSISVKLLTGDNRCLLLRTNSSGEQKSAKLINVADKQIDIEKGSAIYCSLCEKTNYSRIVVVNHITTRETASKIALSSARPRSNQVGVAVEFALQIKSTGAARRCRPPLLNTAVGSGRLPRYSDNR